METLKVSEIKWILLCIPTLYPDVFLNLAELNRSQIPCMCAHNWHIERIRSKVEIEFLRVELVYNTHYTDFVHSASHLVTYTRQYFFVSEVAPDMWRCSI